MPAQGVQTPRVMFSSSLGIDLPAGTTLDFCPLAEAAFGVEVRGVTWDSDLRMSPEGRDAEVQALTLAIRVHHLLVLRGQASPSDDQLDKFLRRFGRLVLDTVDGRAHYADHLNRPGEPMSEMRIESKQYLQRSVDNTGSTRYVPGPQGISELVWHNDQSHRPMLKVLSVFEALDIEDNVVPTEFRDTYAAYDLMSTQWRADLQTRQAVYFNPRLPGPDELPRLADATKPVLLSHPHTGRYALYLNDFASRLVGLESADSEAQMARVRKHLDTFAPRYLHHWQPGDILIWDNVGLQHRRNAVPGGQRRIMRQHGGLAE
jgi:alpha-ketoglutarate-dependent taurine dioxygenase